MDKREVEYPALKMNRLVFKAWHNAIAYIPAAATPASRLAHARGESGDVKANRLRRVDPPLTDLSNRYSKAW